MTEMLDVKRLPYMPLVIDQLQKSKAWLRCKRRPELAFYMMNLWMRAWHEVPAGSIENDDDVLADAAMCDPDKWESIRDDVLRGWESGNDGRIYHSTITKLAIDASAKLKEAKARTAKARQIREQNRNKAATDDVTDSVTDHVAVSVTDDEGKGREVKGKEEGKKEDGATASAVDTEYAFIGRVVRLNTTHFNTWKKNYPNIRDLIAELQAADDYYSEHPPKKGGWFYAVSAWLKRANERALEKTTQPDLISEAHEYAEELRRRNAAWGVY